MTTIVTETFFLPKEVSRKNWLIPAELYNLYHSLLKRSTTGHVFVPIRSLQFMAVLDKDEIVFVDSQSYAVSKDEGGRLILLAWKIAHSHDRVYTYYLGFFILDKPKILSIIQEQSK